jgi:hypothetical protein
MPQSPRITHLEWGAMEAEGLAPARDMKLWPGGGRAWDWRETGTHHVPGIQIADVEETPRERRADRCADSRDGLGAANLPRDARVPRGATHQSPRCRNK